MKVATAPRAVVRPECSNGQAQACEGVRQKLWCFRRVATAARTGAKKSEVNPMSKSWSPFLMMGLLAIVRVSTLGLLVLLGLGGALVAADCNGNGIPDFEEIRSGALPDCNGNGVPDDCDLQGLRFAMTFVTTPTFPIPFASSDLDADGLDDLYGFADDGDLVVFWNGGPRGFLPEARFPGMSDFLVMNSVTGDLDGDGDREIVFAAQAPGLRILENRGNRTFEEVTGIPFRVMTNQFFVVDFDGDLDLDIAAMTSDLLVFENRGGGTFGESLIVGRELNPRILEVADLDGDGRLDLVADSLKFPVPLVLFWNEGLLAFKESLIDSKPRIREAAITDADGDGDNDIFLFTDRLALFRNSGGRTFAFEDFPPNLVNNGRILPGDFDLDGDQDLVVSTFDILALLNRGGGAFDRAVRIAPIMDAGLAVAGDWNSDGAMDLARIFWNLDPTVDSPQLHLLTNGSEPAVSRDTDSNGIPDECQPRAFHRGDANGDGEVNVTDPVFTLRHLFQGERAPSCLEAADTNNDAQVGITDAVAALDFLFQGGPAPAPPGPAACGLDPDSFGSAGDIGCAAYDSCGA